MTDPAWSPFWPDWQDGGKAVDLLMDDGRILTGELYYDDELPCDAGPIWRVRLLDGSSVLFADRTKWRFSAKPPQEPQR